MRKGKGVWKKRRRIRMVMKVRNRRGENRQDNTQVKQEKDRKLEN